MQDFKKLVIYPLLNTHPPIIPERSIFYPLEPIGIGTAYCESLISYITRLAHVHCVSPRKLIKEVINKQLNITTAVIQEPATLLDFILRLESKTQKSNLHCLTFLTWSQVIKPLRLYKSSISWCPLCYEEWREQNKKLYLPIIWLIAEVKVCPIHNHILLQNCFECGYRLKSIARKSKIGYCPKCKAWLGYRSNNQSNTSNFHSSFSIYPLTQQYIIKNLSDLIIATPMVNHCVLTERIRAILRNKILFEQIQAFSILQADNNSEEGFDFALKIDLDFAKFKIFYILKEVAGVPSLITLLKMTYYYNISLIDFLFQDFASLVKDLEKTLSNLNRVKSD